MDSGSSALDLALATTASAAMADARDIEESNSIPRWRVIRVMIGLFDSIRNEIESRSRRAAKIHINDHLIASIAALEVSIEIANSTAKALTGYSLSELVEAHITGPTRG
jgi:hypothetical protein